MLAADKDRLVAGLKQRALELRHKELMRVTTDAHDKEMKLQKEKYKSLKLRLVVPGV